MWGKFKINLDYYPIDSSKFIYIKNRIKKKFYNTWNYLLFQINYFFANIKDLFNYLENIFGNFYLKENIMEKFREFKIVVNLFNDFHSKFIYLALDLEYTWEMVI